MSKKALLIEDDDMTIICLKNFLKQEGFEAETAENGNAGIEKLKSSSFDVIMVDFNFQIWKGIKY